MTLPSASCCSVKVMRGSIAAVEQHPGPLTPPGEVAGVSFAPQAELVFEEDEYTRNRRREVQVSGTQRNRLIGPS